ncbi:hypothetical protein MTR67_043659 [Solanum verrucosum]|uniref:Uncharacterized protein n=1 Tax=Solanum verrucosum TaxID=315347 RepID=A0AAF0UQQ0_SOLVR|nr:hypothetical protein MTR67_043659 [Solanum verrucosum]
MPKIHYGIRNGSQVPVTSRVYTRVITNMASEHKVQEF